MHYLASNLRHLRRVAKLSQQGLADQIGLNRGNIASYEKGSAEPNLTNLLKISRFFSIDLYELLEEDLSHKLEAQASEAAIQEISQPEWNEILERVQAQSGGAGVLFALGERSNNLRTILEGMREYQRLRRKRHTHPSRELESLLVDLDRTLEVATDIMDTNRQLLRLLAPGEAPAPAEPPTKKA